MQDTRRVKGKKIFLTLFAWVVLNIFQTNNMGGVQAAQITKPVTTIPVYSVILTPNNRKMQIGDTLDLLLTIQPSNATNKSVTWSSFNNSVATVTSTGKVTAVGSGSATITVTSSNGKRAISAITVVGESSEQVTTTEERTTEKVTETTTEKATEKTTEPATDAADTGNNSANQPTEKTTEVSQPAMNEPQTEKDTKISESNKTVTAGTKLVGTELVYKVTDVNRKTVSVKSAKAEKTKVVIPAVVRYKGIVYQVNAIEDYAFKNNKKVKKVIIGKNITVIGKQAFYGCKKLKKIDIRTKKLSKVGSKAFKKINKNPTVKVPKGKIKKYNRLFRGKI